MGDSGDEAKFQEEWIPPGSEVELAVWRRGAASVLFKPAPGSPLLSLPLPPPSSYWTIKADLMGTHLNAATVIMHPEKYEGLGHFYSPEVDTFPKLHYEMLVHLAEQLNFSFSLKVVNDYGWETEGRFGGLMGVIEQGEAAIAATGLFVRHDRMRVVDYTVETYALKSVMILRQPLLSTVANIFLLVFDRDVWLACVLFGGVSLAVLLLGSLCRKYQPRLVLYSTPHSLADVTSLLSAILCQQGWHQTPVSIFTKFTMVTISLAALFLYTSYAGCIVALLQSPSTRMNTVRDLLYSPFEIRLQEVNYNKVFFEEATDPDIVDLYKEKILKNADEVYCTPSEGIKLVRSGLYAFLVEVNFAYKLISETFKEEEKCGLTEMALFRMPKVVIAVAKHSGYREIVAQKVGWQKEVGVMDRVGRKWLPQRPRCEATRSSYRSVSIDDFHPALLVLLYGKILSLLILMLEFLAIRHRKIAYKIMNHFGKKSKLEGQFIHRNKN